MQVCTSLKKHIKIEFKLFELMSKNLAFRRGFSFELMAYKRNIDIKFPFIDTFIGPIEKETFHAITKITL